MSSDEKDVKVQSASDSADRRVAILCLLFGIPAFMIVAHFAGAGRGRAAGLCVAVDALAVVFQRETRGQLRFWFAISLILLFQTIAIFLVPFGDESLPAYGLLPAAIVVYLFNKGIIYLFGA